MAKNYGHKILNFLKTALVKIAAVLEPVLDVLIDIGTAIVSAFIAKKVGNDALSEALQEGVEDAAEVIKDVDLTELIKGHEGIYCCYASFSDSAETLELAGVEAIITSDEG